MPSELVNNALEFAEEQAQRWEANVGPMQPEVRSLYVAIHIDLYIEEMLRERDDQHQLAVGEVRR